MAFGKSIICALRSSCNSVGNNYSSYLLFHLSFCFFKLSGNNAVISATIASVDYFFSLNILVTISLFTG